MKRFRFASVPPQIQSFDFGDDPTNTGDAVGIHCIANKGDLPVDIHWILNSSPIISGENGITIMKMNQRTSSLNINSVEGMHRGVFKCLVSNQAGTVEHTAELRVNGSFTARNRNTCCQPISFRSAIIIHFVFMIPMFLLVFKVPI